MDQDIKCRPTEDGKGFEKVLNQTDYKRSLIRRLNILLKRIEARPGFAAAKSHANGARHLRRGAIHAAKRGIKDVDLVTRFGAAARKVLHEDRFDTAYEEALKNGAFDERRPRRPRRVQVKRPAVQAAAEAKRQRKAAKRLAGRAN